MTLFDLPVSAILIACIALAAFLVYAPFLVVAYARLQVGLDLGAPRAMFDKLPDYGKRATWAHQNSFETFTLFAAAALSAYVTLENSSLAAYCAIAFVIARFLYSIFYIVNLPFGRSLMFAIGSGSTFTLFVLSFLGQIT
ncbi:MAG: MAPEG family protein [Okeania sp. SIO2H7]|nr:MAPEG family protein [Okeania sp. SIO2H7]